jgi:O-acetylhomoserine/O-acetylserine sulfhydrylase-like pyridoxal-dependent enzyme
LASRPVARTAPVQRQETPAYYDRLSVRIEDASDVIADLTQAFAAIA